MFTFKVPDCVNKKMVEVKIRCELLYAKWLANHKEVSGVYQDGPIKVYV